jgi:hypothetical protein
MKGVLTLTPNIVLVHVRVLKIYVAAVEVLRKKESQDETQFTTKIDISLSSNPSAPPSWNVLFFQVLKTSQ